MNPSLMSCGLLLVLAFLLPSTLNAAPRQAPQSLYTSDAMEEFREIGDRINFRKFSRTLTRDDRLLLNDLADLMQYYNWFSVHIEANSEERWSRKHNFYLAATRADVVAEYLIKRGVDPSRITTSPIGEPWQYNMPHIRRSSADGRSATLTLAW